MAKRSSRKVRAGDQDDARVAGGPGEQAGGSSSETGWYLDSEGRLCYGQECLIIRETPDGLAFELDPSTCSPETRERLIAAAVKGARLDFV